MIKFIKVFIFHKIRQRVFFKYLKNIWKWPKKLKEKWQPIRKAVPFSDVSRVSSFRRFPLFLWVGDARSVSDAFLLEPLRKFSKIFKKFSKNFKKFQKILNFRRGWRLRSRIWIGTDRWPIRSSGFISNSKSSQPYSLLFLRYYSNVSKKF